MKTWFKLLAPCVVALGLLVTFIGLKLLPDILWFDSFGLKTVWLTTFSTRLAVFFAFFGIALLVLWTNLKLTHRFSSEPVNLKTLSFKPPFDFLNELIARYAEMDALKRGLTFPAKIYRFLFYVGMFVLALFFGFSAADRWMKIALFIKKTPFNLADPVFNKDIAFYVFSLPFWQFLQGWLFALLGIALVTSIWIYFSKRVVFLIFSSQTPSKGLKAHLFILLGGICLLLGFGAWMNMFELLTTKHGVVFGIGFTDAHIRLLAAKITAVLLFVQALIFFICAFRRNILLPVYTLGFLLAVSVVFNLVLPAAIQKYVVEPNEYEREKPYILNNILFTRIGFNLNSIQEVSFPAKQNLTAQDIQDNKNTIQNVRLWDPDPLKRTFSQLQEIRLYYEFNNIDIDRYKVNGNIRQVMLSPRELNTSQLSTQAQTWVNQHLVYTHGYGLCMSPVNEVTTEGLPNFYIKDLPPKSIHGLNITRPEIYFGEDTMNYIIVNTKQQEFDYPKNETNVYASYKGKGGVTLNTFWKKALYALHFSELNIFISSLITPESRVVYDRDIKTIAQKVAPFLSFDSDPYLVLTPEGRMVWMLDAYTYSQKFPYSESTQFGVNYIRNSVKATIDAYDGEVHFYVVDQQDPLIASYSKLYPDLFEPFSNMPKGLQEHIRYPQDLFGIQSAIYATYHMNDTQVFYNREDVWSIPKDTFSDKDSLMEPYYIVTKIPGEQNESLILMLPFTPTNKSNMIAWLSANCDLDQYGKLKVFNFPKDKTIYGPSQIEARIDQDTEISQKLTLWGQAGSRVIRGNLMVIPMEESLLYLEPIYLQATQGRLPEFKRVILAYQDSIEMQETLDNAISAIFGQKRTIEKSPVSTGPAPVRSNVIESLANEFRAFKEAAKTGDWAVFGEKLKAVESKIRQLSEQ